MATTDSSLIVRVGANLDELRSGLQTATAGVEAFAGNVDALGKTGASSMNQLDDATRRAGESTSFLSSMQNELLQLFTVDKLVNFGASVLELGDHLVKVSDQTGLTIEQVQRLEYVADQSGTGMGSLTSAIQTLEQRLGSSDSGTIHAIEDLGIKLEEFIQLNPYDQMLQLADAIRRIQDPTEQAAAAAAIFGKNWKEILPAIKSGMKEVADQASVMSDATAKKLDELGDRMSALNTRLKVFAAGAVDWIDRAGEAIGNYASSWVNAGGLTNKEILRITESMVPLVDITNENAAATAAATAATHANTGATSDNTSGKTENVAATKQQTAEQKAYKAILDEMDRTTFQLAMDHEKQWREEQSRNLKARNQEVIDGLNQTKKAQSDLSDFIAQQALSTTDYQILKIHEWADAQVAGFKGTEEQAAAFNAAIFALADERVAKAQATSQAVQQAMEMEIPDIGHGPEEILPWSTLGKGGGTRPGGTIALGGVANVGQALTDFYDSFIGNSAGTPGVGSYGNAAGPAGWNMPRFPGGSSGVTNVFNITQPLGTPQAIAAAVGSAQMSSMRSRGERFRPSGV